MCCSVFNEEGVVVALFMYVEVCNAHLLDANSSFGYIYNQGASTKMTKCPPFFFSWSVTSLELATETPKESQLPSLYQLSHQGSSFC